MLELGGLLSFLGGSAFRMVWGAFSSWLEKRQEIQRELALMKAQSEFEGARWQRQQDGLRLQADLGVKLIDAKRDADVATSEAEGWSRAVVDHLKPVGIYAVDLWNGVIRPGAATIALAMWVLSLYDQGWKLGPWDREIIGVVLGFFFASRVAATGR